MKRFAFACAIVVIVNTPVNAAEQSGHESKPPLWHEQLQQQIQQLHQQRIENQKLIQLLQQRVTELERSPGGSSPPKTPQAIEPSPRDTRIASPSGPHESGSVRSTLPVATIASTDWPAGSALGQGNLFNPQITAFFDLGASLSTNDDNEQFNRFNLREIELDFRAAIAPFADGVLIIAFGEEIEDGDEGIEIDTHIAVEEGYVDFHTLPFDLAVKGGKFRNAFGRNNLLHTHGLPQVTRPLAVAAFLGPEGLAAVGGSVSWLVPNPWDQYIELVGQVVNADGGEESPILGGPDADNPAAVAHLKWFTDLTDTSSLEIGGSYLFGRTNEDADFDAHLFGVDVTYQYRDPESPDTRSLLFQTELFWASNDVDDEDTGPFRNHSFGMYAFGQAQLTQNWYAGVRVDYTEFPNSESRGRNDQDWAVSPYVSWYLTEFLRLRVEYQHREFEVEGDWDSEDNLLFNIMFSIGSHPPHPYWVNR